MRIPGLPIQYCTQFYRFQIPLSSVLAFCMLYPPLLHSHSCFFDAEPSVYYVFYASVVQSKSLMERKCGAKFALGFVFCYEYAMVTQVHIFVYSTQALNLVILTGIASTVSTSQSVFVRPNEKPARYGSWFNWFQIQNQSIELRGDLFSWLRSRITCVC